MENKNIKRDIELLFEVGCMRYIGRFWKRFFNPDVTNNSEHTLRVIWIALLLAEYENAVNKEKVIKIALVHDLAESRTGDVDYLSRQYVERKEIEAISDILKDTAFEKEFFELGKEYEKKETIEAKIVKDADNLDVELELAEQRFRGHCIGKIWEEQRQNFVYPKLFTNSAKKLWDEINQSEINDWHLNANNRFKNGDWK